jgi:hypothetical protein
MRLVVTTAGLSRALPKDDSRAATVCPPAKLRAWAIVAAALILNSVAPGHAGDNNSSGPIDLLQRYPTTLTVGDTAPEHARPWQFSTADMFQLSHFSLDAAQNLRIQAGPSDLGIGYCRDGAVWALVIPRGDGKLTSQAASNEEAVAHVWMRFHPGQIDFLFPPETVSAGGTTNLFSTMRGIARHKFRSVFNAATNAVIPNPNDMIVDVDTREGPRRFFIVDKGTRMAAYAGAFEAQKFRPPPVLTPELAEAAFDQLWEVFDNGYAMFVLRPQVDWAALRDQYRPQALASHSSDEFAVTCADMLRGLRDLHVSLKLAGSYVPVFDEAQEANSNPSAHKTILGSLNQAGRLQWAVTSDQIGFVDIFGWDDEGLPGHFDEALEQMRDTRGLILDVRWCIGGTEHLAQQIAGRFLKKEVAYAYHQFRNGPKHADFTEKFARKVQPRGPWRYDRPVILLMGQKCMSTTESFIGMMIADANLTTMGDHTCGSSGDPQLYDIPLDITVSVPRRLDFKPDGKPLDGHGFQPQIPFKPGPGAFGKARDDVLTAALARLRQGR